MRRTPYLAALSAALLLAGTAEAANTSLVTIGFGTHVGMTHVNYIAGGAANDFVTELNMRLKLVKVLGFDFNYNYLGEKKGSNGEVFASRIRASGLIYVVPTKVVSWYLLGGLGASNFTDMFSKELTKKSFHAGTGLEIYAGSHFTVTAEFLMLIPDVARISLSKHPLEIGADGQLPPSALHTPELKDYISPENFQINVGLRYFF
ncbi:MAG: outer membrane beta-barrel protein [Deltaproteobacteria bacterium]|nr:outer membrane beta-barrel protein [Deltaproteobacteria bacterium]